MKENISKKRKWWAILSYLGILVLLPLIKKQDDNFIVYHAKQGIVLFFFFIAVDFFARVISWGRVILLAYILICVINLIYIIIGIINCARAEKTPLPFIGRIAEKITI